jgi:hypothetical protein
MTVHELIEKLSKIPEEMKSYKVYSMEYDDAMEFVFFPVKDVYALSLREKVCFTTSSTPERK